MKELRTFERLGDKYRKSMTHYHFRAVTDEQVTFSEALVFPFFFSSFLPSFFPGAFTQYLLGRPHMLGTLGGYKDIRL